MNPTYPPRRAFMLYLGSTHAAVDKSSAVTSKSWGMFPEMLHLNPEPAFSIGKHEYPRALQAKKAWEGAPVLVSDFPNRVAK